MYWQWLLISISITFTTEAANKITEPGFKAINFAKGIKGRKLNGNVITEKYVDSEYSCQQQCVRESRCLSYNFGPTLGKKSIKCQLSGSDRFSGLKNFTKDENVLYRGIQSCCETNDLLCGNEGVCIPNYEDDSVRCKCSVGYAGIPCEAKSCFQIHRDGVKSSGVYTINPDGGKPIQVFCDMTTDGGGWTVFQRRLDGSVDFYRDWASYKEGFGNLNGEFWLGNDNNYRLISADDVTMRVDLEDFENVTRYAEYTTFKVANERDKYRLLIGGYSGTAGNSMTNMDQSANNMKFTTYDNDNDINPKKNCAILFKGAWWYRACHWANLNGFYYGGQQDSHGDGVHWKTFKEHRYSLKRTEMKLRPK